MYVLLIILLIVIAGGPILRGATADRRWMIVAGVVTREMDLANLPEQSQTFVNRRVKYTHGHGLTLAAVSDFTADGLPELLVKDIPPTSTHSELAIQRPQIYCVPSIT